jgi:hypothetical protein
MLTRKQAATQLPGSNTKQDGQRPKPKPVTEIMQSQGWDDLKQEKLERATKAIGLEFARMEAESKAYIATALKKIGQCEAGFNWRRVDDRKGYVCEGGSHFVSDEDLKKGLASVFI